MGNLNRHVNSVQESSLVKEWREMGMACTNGTRSKLAIVDRIEQAESRLDSGFGSADVGRTRRAVTL